MLATDDQTPTARDWRCGKCDPDYVHDESGPRESDLRASRNCDSRTQDLFFPWAPSLKVCPNSYMDSRAWQLVGWWMDWKTFGALPFSGGGDVLDQPACVLDVFRLCERTVAEVKGEREKAAKAEYEKQRRFADAMNRVRSNR